MQFEGGGTVSSVEIQGSSERAFYPHIFPNHERDVPLAKPNYEFAKRQREIAKKKKKEDKLKRKTDADAPEQEDGAPPAATATAPDKGAA